MKRATRLMVSDAIARSIMGGIEWRRWVSRVSNQQRALQDAMAVKRSREIYQSYQADQKRVLLECLTKLHLEPRSRW